MGPATRRALQVDRCFRVFSLGSRAARRRRLPRPERRPWTLGKLLLLATIRPIGAQYAMIGCAALFSELLVCSGGAEPVRRSRRGLPL